MVVFETHPNKYLIYHNNLTNPILIDMEKKFPVGVLLMGERYQPEDFIELGCYPLEYTDLPNTVRLVILSSLAILYETALHAIHTLNVDK